jgi:hypothetical protein
MSVSGGVRVYEAYEVKYRVALVRVPFYFLNLLPTSLLYISILFIADKLQPRNINVSFTKNSHVAIDLLIFTFYSDQLVVDVEIGIVNK